MSGISSGALLLQQADELAALSELPDALCRCYLTPQHRQANQLTAQWMQAAGLRTWEDTAGNLWGRVDGLNPDAPALVLGSHLDTVRNAGRYDGMLGVLVAIEALRLLRDENVQLPFPVEVVGFADEEGTRFGTTLLGSRAVTGQWQPQWFENTDPDGITLAQALRDFSLDPERIGQAARTPDSIRAYLEVHIEQGPVLEAENLALGVVTAIAGARRLVFQVQGLAGHAGTVPMTLRQDALVGAAAMVLEIKRLATEHQVVGTVGQLQVKPGAMNVIPGDVEFSLDIRSAVDEQRDAALAAILARLPELAAQHQLQLTWQEIHQAPAVACDAGLQQQLADTLQQLGLPDFRLFSGAGHDAMAMAELAPVGMLFVRCKGGISHNPLESIIAEDVELAVRALTTLLRQYAGSR